MQVVKQKVFLFPKKEDSRITFKILALHKYFALYQLVSRSSKMYSVAAPKYIATHGWMEERV